MASVWRLGGLTWREFARRVRAEFERDNVLGRAAEPAYYFALALFPMRSFLCILRVARPDDALQLFVARAVYPLEED